ncbi:MAG: DUF4450 domain-containing protein [Odoribacteraceae bacterium]|jgi:hypothetical protein|nr:DUF4450 domain-containing protein [Odoribacteraceae bacterium]
MKPLFILLLSIALGGACSGQPQGNRPAWHGKAHALRYHPAGDEFIIENGKIKFNRALYGTNTAFRVETGDLPEFAFYLPGMGGNCQVGVTDGRRTLWLDAARRVVARYRPGAMIHEISDPMLGDGMVRLTTLALAGEEGMITRGDFSGTPRGLRWVVLYGGASNAKFSRSGDLNADPPDAFTLKPERCRYNYYALQPDAFRLIIGHDKLPADEARAMLQRWTGEEGAVPPGAWAGVFPRGASLALAEAATFKETGATTDNPARPVVVATGPATEEAPLFFCLYRPREALFSADALPHLHAEAEQKREELAGRLVIHTPDPYLNTLGGVISTVGDAIYEHPSYLHGAISWRMRLNGWRGAYVADVLGWHDRARAHFSSYALSQLTTPASGPVTADTALNLTRSLERLGTAMFTSGYICREPGGHFRPHHYDMNLVFIDQLLNHFEWTGDTGFLTRMWPALERHLAWEKRVFDPDDDGLYDAYACIWASDGLMYNGGGVTHSSAYNYRANASAAALAEKIGKDPRPYRQEASKIREAIERELWLPGEGQWGEYVDRLGKRRVHAAAGLWTVYHAIDARLPDPFQAYQALRYVDTRIPRIPLVADGLDEGYHLLSTTNWMPYSWSVNNVAFAELMHTALAYWQGGRPAEAFTLWKSTILDAMYCGSSPGNIGQISFYDAARGETYRDFADPAGMAARAVVEGLYGISPDLMNGRLTIRPGFPAAWEHASIHLPYLDFAYARQEGCATYTVAARVARPVETTLEIPVEGERVEKITVNGQPTTYRTNPGAVGRPTLLVSLPAGEETRLEVAWSGSAPRETTPEIIAAINELNVIGMSHDVMEIHDPQRIVEDLEISDSHVQLRLQGSPGEKTLFARLRHGESTWWQPLHVHLDRAVEIIPGANESPRSLDLHVRNNSERPLKGKLVINPGEGAREMALNIAPKSTTGLLQLPAADAVKGTNVVQVHFSGKRYEAPVVNWEIPALPAALTPVEIAPYLNEQITRIFGKNKYLSPRSPYTTLQLPAQGIGEWCHPQITAHIDDSGLREKATGDLFTTPFGLPFITPRDPERPNIAFVSLWDNYPECIAIPLAGRSSHAYFLMAGTTNHMQSQFENGAVTVHYKDGTTATLSLRNPETWAPIERDYYTDGYAFAMRQARPYRVLLKSGLVARDLDPLITRKSLDQRDLDGGAAMILDLPLDPTKELDRLEVSASANDVVIGLMAVTLAR